MNTIIQPIKKTTAEFLQYSLLISFVLFSLYFSVSSYRLYHMKIYDLNALTHKVESVSFKKAKGKQSKPEVWIDLGQPGKFRVVYGSDHALYPLTREIKKGDVITVYLKKSQHAFIDLGMANDVLQIAKNRQVVYSFDIPKKSFHDYYLISAIISFMLPLCCIFYWIKSRSNSMLEVIPHSAYLQHTRITAD
jgi:ribosomal protein S25